MRERVKCRQCGHYMTSAVTPFGPMDEEGIVVFVKMQAGETALLEDERFTCGECGAAGLKNFVIEAA